MKRLWVLLAVCWAAVQPAQAYRVNFDLAAPIDHAFVYVDMWNGQVYAWTLFPIPLGTVPAGPSSYDVGQPNVKCWAIVATSGTTGGVTSINSSINPPDGLPFEVVFPGYSLPAVRTDVANLYVGGAFNVQEAYRLFDFVLTNEDTLKTDFPTGSLDVYTFNNGTKIGTATFVADPTTETLVPNSQSVYLGRLTGGNLASLAADDNDAQTLCKFFVPVLTSPIVRFGCTFTTTKPNPTSIELVFKARMADSGLFKVRGTLHDFVTNADQVVVPDTTVNLTYAVYQGSATGSLSNFLSALNLLSKIELRQAGPSTALLPCSLFEYVNLRVTG